ncbi:FMN-binding negative transcriptional regulator [Streptomyces sp. NPDC001340]
MTRLFVPGPYREPDASWAVDLVRSFPLAVLMTNGSNNDVPFATHLPLILDPETTEHPPADLTGTTLLGHMNRANPHWPSLQDGMRVLAVFTGAHAYVSPTVYAKTPAAPTWNFTSVHVHGVLSRLDAEAAAERTLGVVQSTVRAFEARFGDNWDMSSSVDYFRQIVSAVGAFRIEVDRVDSMFKLSQEQNPETSDRVRRAFAQSACTRHRDVAELMSRLPQAVGAEESTGA